MFGFILGLTMLAVSSVLYLAYSNGSYITEAKYVDFSKVFR